VLGSKPALLDNEDTSKAALNIRFNRALLARIDAAAKRLSVSRTAAVHVLLTRALDDMEASQ
jgi:hypothetical protein